MLNIIMINNDKLFAFVFPGQGSQIVGMGKSLYEQHNVAKETFQEVDDTLKSNLSDIIFNGPEDILTMTVNTQPALMTLSIALIRVLEYELKRNLSDIAYGVCGHSLGEYSALCSIDSLNLADTAKLLRIRGESMQDSVKNIKTKMTAIIGMKIEKIEEIIKKNNSEEICNIANDNCLGQVVVSGNYETVEVVSNECKLNGARSIIDLNVSAPFHCSLMQMAAERMNEALKSVKINQPKTKFISNVTANFETDPNIIKKLLEKQVTNRVRWQESIRLLYKSGISKIVEVGSKKVLSGLNRRMGVSLESKNISNLEEIEKFLEENFKY